MVKKRLLQVELLRWTFSVETLKYISVILTVTVSVWCQYIDVL